MLNVEEKEQEEYWFDRRRRRKEGEDENICLEPTYTFTRRRHNAVKTIAAILVIWI